MKTIEENNRMIAEFMSVNINPNGTFELPQFGVLTFSLYFKTEFSDEQLKYHTSWDWLMPVVEKIERLGFTIEKNFQRIDGDYQCLITKGNDILFQEFNDSSITAMHYVVVEFIEYYNKQK